MRKKGWCGLDQQRLPVSTVLIWVGLFTVSWDRFAQIYVGSFNVKLPVVAFALAFVATLFDWLMFDRRGQKQPMVKWALLCGAGMALGLIPAVDKTAALLQIVTVVIGALVPFAAIYLNVRLFGRADDALSAFIWGGTFAAVFGVYQLAAFYLHLPQVVPYEATGGGLGRISAFSYEAGYFGYLIILVIAALFARAAMRNRPVNRIHLVFLVAVLLLANSRATALTLPLVFVLMLARWPQSRARAKLWPILIVGVWAVAIAALAAPSLMTTVGQRVASIFDPTEPTSNAVRLSLFDMATKILHDHLFGIGPGNLIRYVPLYGGVLSDGATSNSVIANNIWLQAWLDGGPLLLVLEAAFVLIAITTLLRRRAPTVRLLMCGWVTAVLVASVGTSYFWDMKLWAVLALAAAMNSLRTVAADQVEMITAIPGAPFPPDPEVAPLSAAPPPPPPAP